MSATLKVPMLKCHFNVKLFKVMLLRTVKCKECALTLVWGGILCVIFALGYLLFRRIIKEIEKMNRKRTILVFHTVDNLLYKPTPSGYTAPLLGVDLSH
ncbi:hypothetical protein T11_17923 [Trichinella zimbabwensis]|uniref:Uncharacterized protein n=1 Tax=Trichinella zimbabwensis TaxID=268475 RepID=A0A0V1GM46_9BILA|nr:hypothetical protein T11_17923 [Trichinella zimbabwensis]